MNSIIRISLNILITLILLIAIGLFLITIFHPIFFSDDSSYKISEPLFVYYLFKNPVFVHIIVLRIIPFILFFIIIYFIIKYLFSKPLIQYYKIMLIVLPLYVLYGYLAYGGEFWQINEISRNTFSLTTWLKSETREYHFSLSSLLSTIFFVWISFYRNRNSSQNA